MSYVFNNQVIAKATVTDEEDNTFTLQGIAANEQDANVIMGGMSTLLGVVGWSVKDAVRVINQDIEEET